MAPAVLEGREFLAAGFDEVSQFPEALLNGGLLLLESRADLFLGSQADFGFSEAGIGGVPLLAEVFEAAVQLSKRLLQLLRAFSGDTRISRLFFSGLANQTNRRSTLQAIRSRFAGCGFSAVYSFLKINFGGAVT